MKKQDDTVPFNPNNRKHLQALEKWVKKEAKRESTSTYLVIPKDIYKMLIEKL